MPGESRISSEGVRQNNHPCQREAPGTAMTDDICSLNTEPDNKAHVLSALHKNRENRYLIQRSKWNFCVSEDSAQQ